MVDFNDIKFKGKDDDFNTLKGGIKRESITDSSLLNIFDKVDNNPKDGILDAKEVSVFQQKVAEAAQGGRDAKLSKREAGKYLEGLGVKVENSALFSFINKLSSESTKVKSSTVNENGDSVTEYEDGTTETIKKDGTKIVKKGTTTTTYKKNADGEYIISEEVFVDPQDGSTTTTTYENGKKATSKKEYPNGNIEDTTYTDGKKSQTVKTLSNGNTETILYGGEEQPQKRTVTKDDGKTEEVYEYTNGSSFLTTKKENIGTDQERVTTYTKNQDGTITEKSEDSTGTKEVIKDGSNVIKEVVKNNDGSSYEKNVDGNVTTETTIDKSGNKTVKQTVSQGENTVETITDVSKNKTRTVLNENGRALSQSYIDARTGKTQSVTYDGNGNTTGIVVQFGENAQRIANKFGCTKEELLEANGKKPGEDFEVGETIIVPKEIKANNKYLKNRKSAEAAIRAKQIDTQYRRMGLKNYERSGEKFEYGGKTYTVIGTMKTRARLLVRDSKGNITVASHDNKILKESYVLATNAFDSGEKVTGKARGQNGNVVNNGEYVRIGERDAHGRSVVVDKNGQQWIMAHDGTLLKEEYVEASNVYDIAKDNLSTSTFNKGIKYAKVNGKVYYFSADGKVLDQKQAAKMEADAIIKELDDAADGFVFGLGTDEEQMIKANKAITDPAVLAYINEHYADKYADEVASGKYKSAYEAFLASEIKDREVYTLNADLVANGAILEQARRDEVIFTNLTTYGEHSENVNAGLNAVTTRTDYDNLQNASQKYNEEHGIKGHFEDQDSLQALLYHQTDGDAEEMDAANRNLTDGKSVLTEEEKIRIKAEVGTYYVEEGNTEKAYSSFNRDIYAQMDELLPEGKKVADTASQADRMIAGYGEFTNEQIADEAISYLKKAAKAYQDTKEQLSGVAAVNGAGTGIASIYHQNAEDFATKAFQLIKNDEILEIIMKKAPEDYKNITEKIKFETSGDIDFSKLMLESTSVEAVLSQDEISKNQQVVQLIKNNISLLEKSYRDSVDSEGFKMDFINGMRQTMFMGTTRDDVDNVYAIANSNLNKLSMAAEGKLVDANGQPIAFNKAVEMFTGMNLQELNNEYLTHQALGEAGFDVFTSLVTLPIGGAGALKLVGSVGTIGKAVKTVKTLNNVVKAVGSGVAVGTGQYMIDRADMQTSVMGNTMERRAAAENKAMEAGLSAAAGVGIGGATEQVASRVSSTAGKVLTQATGYSADLGSATAITASFNGGDWTEGFGMNAGITSVGYIFGVRTSIKMNGVNAKSLDDLLKLHKLGFENKNLPDPLSESNVNSLKKLKIDEAQNYLTDRGYKVEIKDNKLVYADNQGLHELSFSKTDGVVSNILDTSTKLSDTEFKQITDYMKKCDETEFNRIKQELMDGGLTEEQLKKLDEVTPKPKPITEDNEEIDPANDIKLKEKLGEKLHNLYVKINNAIGQLKTIDGYNKLKTIIETNFSKFKEEMSSLLSKLKAKAQSLKLFDNNSVEIQSPKAIKHSQSLSKNQQTELPSDAKLIIGGEVLDMENLPPNIKNKIDNLQDGQSIKIGRDDINSNNNTISREHLIIKKENGKLTIEDTSTNGTFMMDKQDFEAYKSIQNRKLQNRELNTYEYEALEKQFLQSTDYDFVTLNKLMSKLDTSSHEFRNIMKYTTTNNKQILEQFVESGIKKGSILGTKDITAQDLSLLMTFNRNNSNVTDLLSTPKNIDKFLDKTKQELTKLREVHGENYIIETGENWDISNKEIADAIEFGYTDFKGTNVKVSAADNILDDVENLIHGKDYIQKFDNNTSLDKMFQSTQTGDVASINGTMFVNDGEKMVQLALKEDSFRELFPPVQRFSMHQGRVGTCYLDTSINILANSKKGRAKIYQMIGEEYQNGKKVYYTTTHNGNGQKTYFERFTRHANHLLDRNGLAIIEQGYCKNSGRIAREWKPGETQIMLANKYGYGDEALYGLTGDKAIMIMDKNDMKKKIISLAGRDDEFIFGGTRDINGQGDDKYLNRDYDLAQTHAYSIKGYDKNTNSVLIANPWHSGVEIKVPMDEFLKQFSDIEIAQIM